MNNLKTGLVFDPVFLKHNQSGHPENAKRLDAILTGLKESELIEKLIQAKSRFAEIEEILFCHAEEYVKHLKEFCKKGGGYLDPDTYSNKYSFNAASTAVGSSIDLTKAVIKGELKNGFALVRPPGHHAIANRSMGFCLFGNISISAKAALQQQGVEKIAIVDFDVHHGNGTQALIGDDPNILFISSHQYPFYPGTGNIREIGKGEAEGKVINIPLEAGVGDNGFKKVYEEIVLPALRRFNPDLMLVSAGYDAHWDDPLANLNLSLRGYNWISRELIRLADDICSGKIIFFLEGGYNLNVLQYGVTNTIRSMMGIEFFDDPIGLSKIPEPDINKLINELRQIHKL
jgi:acetoin utilization deacetylase AcuC-like enzyme